MLFAPVEVNLLGFKVNSLDNAASMTVGPSQHIDLFVSYKRNQGIGEQNGDDSPMVLPVSWVADADWIDSPSRKISIL
ncbi:hypothetical protein J31TS4_34750 [Paenibacillus sp. J31TS4]|uniref:hypothetical protein n=1 Tax=Paenibacillus sp. J31TS4 TaxID=2807195 RepID=UPI001B19D7FE|nr:hypothetical protein [Paenibacillus sp. J31TS4]GIP40195.1 hypothetical protein J31TS4_34750 [Paenibacillus sp. J31TS4]